MGVRWGKEGVRWGYGGGEVVLGVGLGWVAEGVCVWFAHLMLSIKVWHVNRG